MTDLRQEATLTMPTTAVITPVRGRLEHLVNARRFLVADAPDVQHIVVAVDTPDVEDKLRPLGLADNLTVLTIPDDPQGMPTAAARNAGAECALANGAQFLVFLDVDCAVLPGFMGAMTRAVAGAQSSRSAPPAVYNAPVTYLAKKQNLDLISPDSAASWISPHPARPNPVPGQVQFDQDFHLLWSLAFGIEAEHWARTKGFDERYVGYGAEDTDFGMRCARAGFTMAWVGGAQVLHQWHPSAIPPVHHLEDIVRNATIYYRTWGSWPMEGWLTAFAQDGLVRWEADRLTLR